MVGFYLELCSKFRQLLTGLWHKFGTVTGFEPCLRPLFWADWDGPGPLIIHCIVLFQPLGHCVKCASWYGCYWNSRPIFLPVSSVPSKRQAAPWRHQNRPSFQVRAGEMCVFPVGKARTVPFCSSCQLQPPLIHPMASCIIVTCPRRSPFVNSCTGACHRKASVTLWPFTPGTGEPAGQKANLAKDLVLDRRKSVFSSIIQVDPDPQSPLHWLKCPEEGPGCRAAGSQQGSLQSSQLGASVCPRCHLAPRCSAVWPGRQGLHAGTGLACLPHPAEGPCEDVLDE